ncbi:MAG: alpha/beta hydrolase, partial [Planctomycetaceae bacterium]|nr:alpha/beta hydrolase [Planctomycetaceae bacterium]
PTFLVHAGDDGISAENSARFYLALKQAGVAGELHIYSNGGHGFGLRPSKFACSKWPSRCEAWLRTRGLLEKK